jgi:hypothetical protein
MKSCRLFLLRRRRGKKRRGAKTGLPGGGGAGTGQVMGSLVTEYTSNRPVEYDGKQWWVIRRTWKISPSMVALSCIQ